MVAFKWKKLPLAFRIKEIIIKNNKKKITLKTLTRMLDLYCRSYNKTRKQQIKLITSFYLSFLQ